jgi:hypothetical protein
VTFATEPHIESVSGFEAQVNAKSQKLAQRGVIKMSDSSS